VSPIIRSTKSLHRKTHRLSSSQSSVALDAKSWNRVSKIPYSAKFLQETICFIIYLFLFCLLFVLN
jgi:hypothetical protein